MTPRDPAPRQVPIPEHMDLYHLHQEAEPSDRTALEAVVVRAQLRLQHRALKHRSRSRVRVCPRRFSRRVSSWGCWHAPQQHCRG